MRLLKKRLGVLVVALVVVVVFVFVATVEYSDAQRGMGRGMFRGMKGPLPGQDHGGGIGSGATPPGAQWYYSAGSDNYPNGQTLSTLDNVGGPITLASGGTITKIAIKIGTTAPENMKIGLYRLVVATWTLVECVTLAYPSANAWAEATLVTPYVTSVGQTVRVIASFDASWSAFYGSATAGTGFWYTNDYNTCCVSTPTMTDDSQWSAAIYY